MFHVPNKYRDKTHPVLRSTDKAGNNGLFIFACRGMETHCVASSGMGWEHVSVSQEKRPPTWETMCFIKDVFWDESDVVVQYHPRKSDYINNHPNCLHMWRPTDKELPVPDSIMVGKKDLNLTERR